MPPDAESPQRTPIFVLSASILLCGANASFAAPAMQKSARILYLEPARALESERLAPAGAERLSFEALGRRFDLELTPTDLLTGTAARDASVVPLQGRLEGRPDSWARLTRVGDSLSGLIVDGETVYAVEAAGDAAPIADAAVKSPRSGTVVYRLKDVLLEDGAFTCGAGDALSPATAQGLFRSLEGELREMPHAKVGDLQFDVGLAADAELYAQRGEATESFMLSRMNVVDGLYAQQAGLRVRVSSVRMFTADPDPFTRSDPAALLEEVSDWRQSFPVRPAVSHLMTGRDLDGDTVGIAYIDAICGRQSASVTEARTGRLSLTLISLIAAHEIGHNLGAPHDGESGKACAAMPTTFLMAPTVYASTNQFSSCSLEIFERKKSTAQCFTAVQLADVEIVPPATSVRHGLDETYPLTFTVRSIGTLPASNVLVSFAVPQGTTLESVAAAGGSCEPRDGATACSLGALGPGVSRTITLSLTGRVIGSAPLQANVSAVGDEVPGNDMTSLALITDPVADLGVTITASSVVAEVGDSVRFEVVIGNAGIHDAPDARLSIDVPGGFEISSIDAPGLGCTTAANSISCDPVRVRTGEGYGVVFDARTRLAGVRSISAIVLSSAIDPDNSNNSRSVAVTIGGATSEPTPTPVPETGGGTAGGGGGGGSLSWEWLLPWLAALILSRGRSAGPSRRPGSRGAPALP